MHFVVKERLGLGEDFIEAGKVCVLKGLDTLLEGVKWIKEAGN